MSGLDITKANSILDSEIVDNDVHIKLHELANKLMHVENEKEKVEMEKQEMQKSYDTQRATYQKLYLQKEDEVKRLQNELADIKTQLYLAQTNETSEMAELRQIVTETVEESSSSQSQVKHLQRAIQVLEEQLASKLTSEKSDSILLAPSNMLSATKSFAKKVVSQLGPDLDRSADLDLEDSMKKASLETGVMRSLIIPLEEEINQLRAKLSSTEEKLRESENGKLLTSQKIYNGGEDGGGPKCEMCANYEAQLQVQQQNSNKLKKQKDAVDANLEKFKEDLAKETQFRKQMEEKWNEKKEEQKLQVAQLKAEVVAGKTEVLELRATFESLRSSINSQLRQLTYDREHVDRQMQAVLLENDNLVGKHNKHSRQLDSEDIDLPNTVEDLQEVLLRLRADLISALVAKEEKEEAEEMLRNELQILRTERERELSSRSAIEKTLTAENSSLSRQADVLTKERNKFKTDVEELRMKEIRYKAEIDSLREQLHSISEENKKKSDAVAELRASVTYLQAQLEGSEAVQKDFVRLSQSLQVELEKIRSADTEVRWQHEDDIAECQGCHHAFASPKKKSHCRHCGKVFCPSCLQHSVLSGPNQRAAHVCQVCHTLLNSDTAPYFSQEPPHSPD